MAPPGGSGVLPTPSLCWLLCMKTTTDPGRHAELRYYSNFHHGIRGLNPTSGLAEARSPCAPPPAPFSPGHGEGTWPASAPGTGEEGGGRCGRRPRDETRSAAAATCRRCKVSTHQQFPFASRCLEKGGGLTSQTALRQGDLRATGRDWSSGQGAWGNPSSEPPLPARQPQASIL